MTKADLVETVAKVAQINKRTAGEAVDATFEGIIKAIKKGNSFQFPVLALSRCARVRRVKGSIPRPATLSPSTRAGPSLSNRRRT